MLANALLSLGSDRKMPREKLVEILHWCVEQLSENDEKRQSHMRANVKLATEDAQLRKLLDDAIAAITTLHASIVPNEDDPILSASLPAPAVRALVDAHARLLYRRERLAAAPDAPSSNLVAELRKLHAEITASDGHESEMMALIRRAADALERAPVETPAPQSSKQKLITDIIRAVCELPDYNSPDDQPELLQCTVRELDAILDQHLPDETTRDAEDAARYRWLQSRDHSLESQHGGGLSCYHSVGGVRELKSGAELDAAVDAAISNAEKTPGATP